MPHPAPRAAIDAASLEQIACAARLLRWIAASDGEIEILVHEMARVLERIAQRDSSPLSGSQGAAGGALRVGVTRI